MQLVLITDVSGMFMRSGLDHFKLDVSKQLWRCCAVVLLSQERCNERLMRQIAVI